MTEKILIVGPSWVGDMVMVHSLLQVLADRPQPPVIDVLAPAWTLPLLERFPEVRRGIDLPFGHGQLALGARWRLGRLLRSERYDRAIILPRSLKSAIVPFAARAQRRTGYLGELRYGLLNDIRRLDKQALPMTVQRFVALGLEADTSLPESIPQPKLTVDAANAAQALERLGITVPPGGVVGLAPGAEYGPAKQWPAGHFATLARTLVDEGMQSWIFGSARDSEAARAIQDQSGEACVDLTGRTSLPEAIDLMGQCQALVTNDSGLMHLGAAVGTHVVALYGSSDPGHTPPLSERAQVLSLGLECSPCFKRVCPLGHTRCLTGITPEAVHQALVGSSER